MPRSPAAPPPRAPAARRHPAIIQSEVLGLRVHGTAPAQMSAPRPCPERPGGSAGQPRTGCGQRSAHRGRYAAKRRRRGQAAFCAVQSTIVVGNGGLLAPIHFHSKYLQHFLILISIHNNQLFPSFFKRGGRGMGQDCMHTSMPRKIACTLIQAATINVAEFIATIVAVVATIVATA
eukprot:SAG31_NODE_4503_length_3181_cov_3.463660_3_plen_177_part_00